MDNRARIRYRLREKMLSTIPLRKSAVALIVLSFAALSAAMPCADAASAARAQSDALVSNAEALIMAAGRSNPTDTAKVHEAIDKLHEALKIDSRNDSAYVDLGFCYGLLRDGTTAVDMYRTATLINPSPSNYKELADVYLRAAQPENALMAANAGLLRDPRNASLYNAKGMALHDLMRFDEAAHAFQQALVYDPSFEIARRNLEALGPGYEKTGRKHAKSD